MARITKPSERVEQHDQICEETTQALENALISADSRLPKHLQDHLESCPHCQETLSLLKSLQLHLLEQVPDLAPPSSTKKALFEQIRAQDSHPSQANHSGQAGRSWSPLRPLWFGAASIAVLISAGTLTLLTQGQGNASGLPDPAVVVNTGNGMIVASNDARGTLSFIQDDKVRASLSSVQGQLFERFERLKQLNGSKQAVWFTQGVRLGSKVFLADAANDRVLEVQSQPLRIVRVHTVPNGVAGLTVSTEDDEHAGKVFFKSTRGPIGQLDGPQITMAREPKQILANVMDGVLLLGGQLVVTHHLSGEICWLDPNTLEVHQRRNIGGKPVALASYHGDILVLDATGRVLLLDQQGKIKERWNVQGQPDKMSLNKDHVVLSDRNGRVSILNLRSGALKQQNVTAPMDVTALDNGHFAIAEAGTGIRIVDSNLEDTGNTKRLRRP